jgi:hypothetical protein
MSGPVAFAFDSRNGIDVALHLRVFERMCRSLAYCGQRSRKCWVVSGVLAQCGQSGEGLFLMRCRCWLREMWRVRNHSMRLMWHFGRCCVREMNAPLRILGSMLVASA